MNDFASKLHEFIVEETGMDATEFNAETALFSEGYIDSFTMTQIIAMIEEEAGITVAQSDITLENFDTIGRMAAYVQRELAAS